MDELVGVDLVKALAAIWAAIRAKHPDVPNVVLLPAPNPHSNANVLGHFAALRWSAKHQGSASVQHEVIVVAEHLDRTPQDVVATLLHEAAHALNFQRGIKDCSKNQYHNRHFENAAKELGLTVSQVPHYGFALTQLPHETAAVYESETKALQAVLIHRRAITAVTAPPTKPKNGDDNKEDDQGEEEDPNNNKTRLKKATCQCPFIIRASRKVLAATTITCGRCGGSFEFV
jgi:hypothetical protein